jgi:uncharacterized protein
MKRLLVLFALVAATAYANPARISLNAGMYVIQAEVMNTQAGRMRGLMHRKNLGANEGMLFIFPAAERHCMWMKNTYVPLSVAFIDERGVVVNIADMQPESETQHCAARPAPYALEMQQGWFAARGIKPGARISGIDKAPREGGAGAPRSRGDATP